MSKTPRPKFNIRDEVRLADHVSVIPAYDNKPMVHRGTTLRVSSISGSGSKRAPFTVYATDGTHFWHFEPNDLIKL